MRVGRAITPPNCLDGPAAPSTMPTAAAVAAAAATAKIQAMEATMASSNNSTAGNTPLVENVPTIPPPGLAIPTPITIGGSTGLMALSAPQVQPVLAANAPGIITGVTVNPPITTPLIAIPPPALITNLPLPLVTQPSATSVQQNNNAQLLAAPISKVNNFNNHSTSSGKVNLSGLAAAQEKATAIAASKEMEIKLEANSAEEPQTLQQQENMVIKGSSARQMLMQKLMRKSEVK